MLNLTVDDVLAGSCAACGQECRRRVGKHMLYNLQGDLVRDDWYLHAECEDWGEEFTP